RLLVLLRLEHRHDRVGAAEVVPEAAVLAAIGSLDRQRHVERFAFIERRALVADDEPHLTVAQLEPGGNRTTVGGGLALRARLDDELRPAAPEARALDRVRIAPTVRAVLAAVDLLAVAVEVESEILRLPRQQLLITREVHV